MIVSEKLQPYTITSFYFLIISFYINKMMPSW